ncbi:MAG: phosphate acyltransferase PlsX [Clostridia bacterium]|nr:phosphate acyltransferase PlsX [Clostridia bacterium]
MKVVIDVFGGDNAPDEILLGCKKALEQNINLSVVLCGDEFIIKQKIHDYDFDPSRVEILHAPEVITNEDVPTEAIRNKKNSSLVAGFTRLKEDPECAGIVSAGSTGAVLTGAFLKVGRIKGIMRPALAPLLPTLQDKEVLIVDCGANVDCKPQMLVQFAHMGAAYMKCVKGVKSPKIGLLSNGTEDKKGNELTKETFGLLKEETDLNFIGNMEARDILSGEYDVVVTDGFYGNIALKSIEGTAIMILKTLKKSIKSDPFSVFGSLFMKKTFKNLKNTMDYNKKGGAPLIGTEKIVIKAHGSSKAESICGAINQVIEMHQAKLIENIKKNLKVVNVTD